MFDFLQQEIDCSNNVSIKVCKTLTDVPLNKGSLNELRILNFNIRSLNHNLDGLLVYLNKYISSLDVIVLSETWNYSFLNFHIDNFYHYFSKNAINKAEGVSVFVAKRLKITCVEIDIVEHCNSVNIKFELFNELICLTAIYRSFDRDLKSFANSLDFFLVSSKFDKHIICGDMNINLLNCNITSVDYSNMMAAYGYLFLVDKATRVKGSQESLLDHVFIKGFSTLQLNSYLLETYITDHFPIIFVAKLDLPKTCKVSQSQRCKEIINFDLLLKFLENESWDKVYETRYSVDLAFDKFSECLFDYINNSLITVKVKRQFVKIKCWITKGILVSIKNRDNLYRKAKKNPALSSKFKRYRNLLTKIIKCAKFSHFKQIIADAKMDSKKIWETVRTATNDKQQKHTPLNLISVSGDIISDNVEVANMLNKYFSSVGVHVKNEIQNEKLKSSLSGNDIFAPISQNKHSNIFFLKPVTSTELQQHIMGLKDNNSFVDNLLTNFVIKKISNYIVPPLVHIFNLCFSLGQYPTKFKKSLIIPLFKSGSKLEVSNYRPISLTLSLSKLLEKVIKSRLVHFLMENKIISPQQYGFFPGRSTEQALFNVVDCVLSEKDKGKYVFGCFLDIKKAFDSVDHEILLSKLANVGIINEPLNLFRSYLSNRIQITKVGTNYSDVLPVLSGIPQGTVLGPLLFILYVNDIFNIGLAGKIFSYADDTCLIFSGNNGSDLIQIINSELRKIKIWLNNNYLFLNTAKCSVVNFSPRKKMDMKTLKIAIHNCRNPTSCSCDVITESFTVKYLGVHLDSKLNFNLHINTLIRRLRLLYYKFRILRNFMSVDLMRLVYYALAQSILVYGVVVWGGTNKSLLQSLSATQNILLRIILSKPRRYSTKDLFAEFRVMNLDQIIMKMACYYVLQNKLSIPSLNRYNTRQKCKNNFFIPKANTQQYYNFSLNLALRFLLNNNFNSGELINNKKCKQKIIKVILDKL